MKYPQGSWAQAWSHVRLAIWATAAVLAAGPGAVAFAGPNAGGTLLIHTDRPIVFSVDEVYSGLSGIDCDSALGCPPENAGSCQEGMIAANPDGGDGALPQVWWVFAAFPPTSCPRVTSVSFGVYFPEAQIEMAGFGYASDHAAFTGSFPFQDGSGGRFGWSSPVRSPFIEVCWLAGRVLSGTPVFALGMHPSEPTEFLDDSGPRLSDPIDGFSALGFGTLGIEVYPEGLDQIPRVCCFPDGRCEIRTSADCARGGGSYPGDLSVCAPNPCPQPSGDGACCLDDGTCSLEREDPCVGQSGEFLGEGTSCDPHPCDLEPYVDLGIEGGEGSRSWAVAAPRFVESIEGFYRMGGESNYRRLLDWTRGLDGVWRTGMDEAHYTERGLEYHLLFDGSIPVGAPDRPKRLRTTGHAVNGPRLLSGRWSMVSAPVLVDGTLNYYGTLLEIFGDPGNDAWRVGTYDPVRREYTQVSAIHPAAFEPGRAYWIGAVDPPSNWSIQGGAHMPLDGALDYIVPLRPGWNMVGNPAPYSVTLDRSLLRVVKGDTLSFAAAASASNQWVASSILTFDPSGDGSYKEELITLPVWGGCWVKNRTASVMALLIPSTEALSSRAGDGSLLPVWAVEFVARSAEETRSVLIGVVEDESPSGSDFGFAPPPAPGTRLDVALFGGSGTLAAGEKLFRELRTEISGPEETWRIRIDAAEGPVSLGWAYRTGSADGWELRLRDGAGAESTLDVSGEIVVPTGKHEIEIVARRTGPGNPEIRSLSLEIQPNPTTSSAYLRYQVPFSARVLLQVFDPGGGRVWMEESEVGPGEHTAVWDGRTLDGPRAASGVYFVRADAVSRGSGAADHRVEKLVLVR